MKVPLALVYEPREKTREMQEKAIAGLMSSINAIGLRTPITVRSAKRIRDGQPADAWEVTAGRHRVEAARRLGWTDIDAVTDTGDEVQNRLWEISENLHRAELTALERSEHQAEWIRLTETENQSEHPAPIESKRADGRGHRIEGGINAAVEHLGIERTQAHRAVQIAEGITPEAKQAAQEAGIDNTQSYLMEVARARPENQLKVVTEMKKRKDQAEENRAKAAANRSKTKSQTSGLKKLLRAWDAATTEDRASFIRERRDEVEQVLNI